MCLRLTNIIASRVSDRALAANRGGAEGPHASGIRGLEMDFCKPLTTPILISKHETLPESHVSTERPPLQNEDGFCDGPKIRQ